MNTIREMIELHRNILDDDGLYDIIINFHCDEDQFFSVFDYIVRYYQYFPISPKRDEPIWASLGYVGEVVMLENGDFHLITHVLQDGLLVMRKIGCKMNGEMCLQEVSTNYNTGTIRQKMKYVGTFLDLICSNVYTELIRLKIYKKTLESKLVEIDSLLDGFNRKVCDEEIFCTESCMKRPEAEPDEDADDAMDEGDMNTSE